MTIRPRDPVAEGWKPRVFIAKAVSYWGCSRRPSWPPERAKCRLAVLGGVKSSAFTTISPCVFSGLPARKPAKKGLRRKNAFLFYPAPRGGQRRARARGTLFKKGREPFPQRTRADVHPRPLRLAAARNPEANSFAQGRRFLLAAAVPLRLAVYRSPPGAEHGKSTCMAGPRERQPGRLVC